MPHLRSWTLFALLVAVRSASGQTNARLVAIDPGASLEHAASLALTSWHVEVVAADGPSPDRDMDNAIRTAHRIARSSRARAVVWLSPDASATYSLWVYDDRTHTITVRPLAAAPPYDDETAAAVAMTMKTLLLDVFERPAPPPPQSTDDDEARAPAPRPHATARHSVRIDTFGGVRIPTNATDSFAVRLGAELTYFPLLFRQCLGLAVAVDGGPSVLVEHDPYFVGAFTDTVASATVRFRIPLRRFMSLELGAGPGVHFSAIEGSGPNLSGRISRTDPSLETVISLELQWNILRVAPLVGTSFLMRYQHYSTNGIQVLDVPPAQMIYGLRLGVELP